MKSATGRRAFGRQRRMSQDVIVRNIVDSILSHADKGLIRPVFMYTKNTDTQELVLAQLEKLGLDTQRF